MFGGNRSASFSIIYMYNVSFFFVFEGVTDTSKQPTAVGNPKQHHKPMPDHKQGGGVAQNEPAQQPKPKPSSTTQQHRQTTEQATENARETNQEASTNKKKRTNKQCNPNRSPTQP